MSTAPCTAGAIRVSAWDAPKTEPGTYAGRLLTTGQVAKKLQINPATVWKLIQGGRIPAVRIGGRYRVPGEWVDEELAPLAPIRRKAPGGDR